MDTTKDYTVGKLHHVNPSRWIVHEEHLVDGSPVSLHKVSTVGVGSDSFVQLDYLSCNSSREILMLRAIADYTLRIGCAVSCQYQHRVFAPPNMAILQCALCVHDQHPHGYLELDHNKLISDKSSRTMSAHLETHHLYDVVIPLLRKEAQNKDGDFMQYAVKVLTIIEETPLSPTVMSTVVNGQDYQATPVSPEPCLPSGGPQSHEPSQASDLPLVFTPCAYKPPLQRGPDPLPQQRVLTSDEISCVRKWFSELFSFRWIEAEVAVKSQEQPAAAGNTSDGNSIDESGSGDPAQAQVMVHVSLLEKERCIQKERDSKIPLQEAQEEVRRRWLERQSFMKVNRERIEEPPALKVYKQTLDYEGNWLNDGTQGTVASLHTAKVGADNRRVHWPPDGHAVTNACAYAKPNKDAYDYTQFESVNRSEIALQEEVVGHWLKGYNLDSVLYFLDYIESKNLRRRYKPALRFPADPELYHHSFNQHVWALSTLGVYYQEVREHLGPYTEAFCDAYPGRMKNEPNYEEIAQRIEAGVADLVTAGHREEQICSDIIQYGRLQRACIPKAAPDLEQKVQQWDTDNGYDAASDGMSNCGDGDDENSNDCTDIWAAGTEVESGADHEPTYDVPGEVCDALDTVNESLSGTATVDDVPTADPLMLQSQRERAGAHSNLWSSFEHATAAVATMTVSVVDNLEMHNNSSLSAVDNEDPQHSCDTYMVYESIDDIGDAADGDSAVDPHDQQSDVTEGSGDEHDVSKELPDIARLIRRGELTMSQLHRFTAAHSKWVREDFDSAIRVFRLLVLIRSTVKAANTDSSAPALVLQASTSLTPPSTDPGSDCAVAADIDISPFSLPIMNNMRNMRGIADLTGPEPASNLGYSSTADRLTSLTGTPYVGHSAGDYAATLTANSINSIHDITELEDVPADQRRASTKTARKSTKPTTAAGHARATKQAKKGTATQPPPTTPPYSDLTPEGIRATVDAAKASADAAANPAILRMNLNRNVRALILQVQQYRPQWSKSTVHKELLRVWEQKQVASTERTVATELQAHTSTDHNEERETLQQAKLTRWKNYGSTYSEKVVQWGSDTVSEVVEMKELLDALVNEISTETQDGTYNQVGMEVRCASSQRLTLEQLQEKVEDEDLKWQKQLRIINNTARASTLLVAVKAVYLRSGAQAARPQREIMEWLADQLDSTGLAAKNKVNASSAHLQKVLMKPEGKDRGGAAISHVLDCLQEYLLTQHPELRLQTILMPEQSLGSPGT